MNICRNTITVLLAVLFLTACHVGPQIENVRTAVRASGAEVMVKAHHDAYPKRRQYVGELLEVDNSGVLLNLTTEVAPNGQVTLVPWSIIKRIDAISFPGLRATMRSGGSNRESVIEKMRLASRYPQGLSPELRRRLLESYNQSSVNVIEKER